MRRLTALFTLGLLACSGQRAERFNAEGRACLDSGNLRCALERFSAAVKVDPASGKYRYNLGLALARAGAYQQAIEELKVVVATDPTDIAARQTLDRVQAALDGQRAADMADNLRN